MAYSTTTVPVTSTVDWTLITSKVALLQFNSDMYMAISSGVTPTSEGFRMTNGEKYVNSLDGVYVWAKAIEGSNDVHSVRVAEDSV